MDEHSRPTLERIRLELERVAAVLERVLGADRLERQLPRPPGRDEAAAELVGDRRADEEAPRLAADHDVRLPLLRPVGKQVDRLP